MLVCGLIGSLVLDWWIGDHMAKLGGPVWAWLSLGILLNGFAHLPYTLLHSAGRSDITAKFHLAELLPYLVSVAWALTHYGIVGAAAVWSARCAIDTALLYIAAARLRPDLKRTSLRTALWAFGACLVLGLAQGLMGSVQPAWPENRDALYLGAAALAWTIWRGRRLKTIASK